MTPIEIVNTNWSTSPPNSNTNVHWSRVPLEHRETLAALLLMLGAWREITPTSDSIITYDYGVLIYLTYDLPDDAYLVDMLAVKDFLTDKEYDYDC